MTDTETLDERFVRLFASLSFQCDVIERLLDRIEEKMDDQRHMLAAADVARTEWTPPPDPRRKNAEQLRPGHRLTLDSGDEVTVLTVAMNEETPQVQVSVLRDGWNEPFWVSYRNYWSKVEAW